MGFGCTHHHMRWMAERSYGTAPQPSEFEVLLYDDDADEIGPADDLANIETEPTDGNYIRESYVFPGDIAIEEHYNGVALGVVPATFDFTDVTGEVDAAGVVWEAELPDDDGATPHLMVRQELDERYDLSEYSGESTVNVEWQLQALY